jgi:hypothetical protein
MSRIADAVARSSGLIGSVPPSATATPDVTNPRPPEEWGFDMESAAAQEARPLVAQEARPIVVARSPARMPDSEGPARGPDPHLIELVQRVFRPGAEPLARVVTIAAVGRAATPRALSLSMAGTLASYKAGSVCVVDASAGATGRQAADDPQASGVGDMLSGAVAPVSVAVPAGTGIWLVPAGSTPWPADWHRAWPQAVAVLAGAFDYVLVVTAAVEEPAAVGAFLALATATDGVLLTVDLAHTRSDVAADVVSRVRASGVEVFGAITVQAARGGPRGARRGRLA